MVLILFGSVVVYIENVMMFSDFFFECDIEEMYNEDID